MKDPISAFLGTANVARVVNKEIKAVEIVHDLNEGDLARVESNLTNDYEYARNNIRNLINEQMSLIPELSSVVIGLQTPDGYDSAAKFIASVVTANDKLVHLSERQLYIKKPKGEKNNIDNNQNKENNIVETQNNVTNNLMITMTTADLLNSILEKEMNKETITVE